MAFPDDALAAFRMLSGPREQRPARWIPTRGALPTRLNGCAIPRCLRYLRQGQAIHLDAVAVGASGESSFHTFCGRQHIFNRNCQC